VQVQKPKQGFKQVKWHYKKIIEIPESWDVERLGKLCKLRKDAKITSDLYIGLEHISSGSNTLEGKGNVSEFSSTKNEFYEGDVLYGKLRPLLNKVWLATESGYCSTDILSIVSSKKILNRMLLQILSYHYFFSYAVGTSAGTKMPRTNWSDIKKFIVFLPSFPEQEKISFMLFNIENLIDSYNKTITTSKKLKKGLMQTLLTKGIGHKKFKKVTLFPRYDEEKIPEDWDYDRTGKLLKIIDYRGRTPPFSEEGVIHLRSNNIKNGKINFENITFVTEETYDKYMVRGIPKEHDVLFTTEGPLGEVALVPKSFKFSLAQRIIVLRPKTKDIDSNFLKYLLQNKMVKDRYEGLSTGTTLGGIASKWFTKLFLMFPKDVNEQQKIASILSKIDSKISDFESKRITLENLKKSLMQKLLTGQIRVSSFSN